MLGMSLEEKNETGQKKKSYSSDKSPLLHANSTPNILCGNNGKNKNTFSVTHSDTVDGQLPYLLSYNGDERCKNYSTVNYDNEIFNDGYGENFTNQDIAAMSVVSLYQSAENLESDMDTDRLVLGIYLF